MSGHARAEKTAARDIAARKRTRRPPFFHVSSELRSDNGAIHVTTTARCAEQWVTAGVNDVSLVRNFCGWRALQHAPIAIFLRTTSASVTAVFSPHR